MEPPLQRSHFSINQAIIDERRPWTWYETEIKGGRLKHPAVPRRYLDNYMLPEFGDTVPADITPAMAARLLARVGKKAPTAANDLLRHMRRVFRFAVRRHLMASSPVADFNLSDAGGQESAQQRSLSRDELERLFKALRDSPSFGGTNLLTIKLLLALGVRKGELLGAKWSEFDLDGATDLGPVWRLPAKRTKTSAPLSIPLAPAVVEWLKALREVACGSEFVLPKRRRDRRQRALHVGIDTLNAALAGVDHGLDEFTIHDLRRTMRPHLSSLGIRSEVAERCLNHKLPGLQGVYNARLFCGAQSRARNMDNAAVRNRARRTKGHSHAIAPFQLAASAVRKSMRTSVGLYDCSGPVAKCDWFPEASRYAPQILVARGGAETRSLRPQFATFQTGRVRKLEVCT